MLRPQRWSDILAACLFAAPLWAGLLWGRYASTPETQTSARGLALVGATVAALIVGAILRRLTTKDDL